MPTDQTPQPESFSLLNRHGDPIRGNIHVPAHADRAPVIVICHGFKGFKDWGSFPAVAAWFAAAGWYAVRFNFSLNGIGEDGVTFTRLEDFRRNTLTRELDDLSDVLDAVLDRRILPVDADTGRLALLGHSRGGGVAILQTASDPRVRALVTWAAVATFDRWGPESKRLWRERGVLDVLNARTNQLMPLGVEVLEDFERNAARLDVLDAAARIDVPFLVVHGDQDVSVPAEEARRLHAAARPSVVTLEIIPNTDHVFGAAHPFQGLARPLTDVLETTNAWLARNL